MPKKRQNCSQKSRAKRAAGNVAARIPIEVTTEQSPTDDPNPMYGKDLSCQEQNESSYKKQKDSSSKEQNDLSSEEQKDSSSKEQKDSSSEEQKDSSAKEQKDSSSEEKNDLSSKEQIDLSSDEQKDSLSKEQKDLSSKEEKDSPSEEQKDSPSEEQKNSSSEEQNDSSSKEENTITDIWVIGCSTLTELREYSDRSWESIVEFQHEMKKPDKPAIEKDPSNRGEHVINNGVLKIYRDVVEEFVADAFRTNLSFLESNVLREDSSVLRAIREPVPRDVMHQIANVMVVDLQKSYMDSNAEAFGTKLTIVKGTIAIYMLRLYKITESPNLTGMERNIAECVSDFIRGGFFIDDDALNIWCKRSNVLRVFERARGEVESMLRRLIPHRENNPLADWVSDLCKRHVICVGIHNISRDVVEEFVRDVLEGNLKLSDLENKTLSRNSSVLRAIRELDCPKVMSLLRMELVVDIRHEASYQLFPVAGKIQQIKNVFVAHMKSIYRNYVPPHQADIALVEDFIANEDYVDKDVLRIWLGYGNNVNFYKEASGRVASVLRRMIPLGRNNQLALWVKELYNAAEKLLEQRR